MQRPRVLSPALPQLSVACDIPGVFTALRMYLKILDNLQFLPTTQLLLFQVLLNAASSLDPSARQSSPQHAKVATISSSAISESSRKSLSVCANMQTDRHC